ncbi:unnamed protein product [Tilletia controversa]|uniref:F-box domain-containing protein n=3 Tax=Tilletia TaxID=13289 RepID=A0A8X7SVF6_9BASI|nr:hypothetical protein CF336_g5282 [Tilletia laevis]KAE8192577.1 hypothetical protein CF328_g5316 [Tilletia controversa]KAE8257644.1 hypothetical protein A4X03_0g4605 [Tilletia caries]KAE8195801.1 hypothetical protein CF335_g5005 [Tilletia laevis]KAE8243628.1 hypothetical protein A4X06_0g6188 [Tilletia controversa]
MDIDNNETQSASAVVVRRFLDVPELVGMVLGYLSRDRTDLLQLSLVCRSLRVQALHAWSRHLDIPITAAIDRFRLFSAHPSLLSAVRFLRIRNDVVDRGLYGSTSRGPKPSSWTKLNKLLSMLDGQIISASSSGDRALPLIDVTIRPQDRLRLPSVLKQRVVALRILPVNDRLSRIDQELESDDDDEHNFDCDDEDSMDYGDEDNSDEDGPYPPKKKQKQKRPSTPESASEPGTPIELDDPEPESDPELSGSDPPKVTMDLLDKLWGYEDKSRKRLVAAKEQRGWKELIDIIQQAGNGPGLRTFHFGVFECPAGNPPSEQLLQQLWETLVTQHAAHLLDLSLNLGTVDIPDAILASENLSKLEVFNLERDGLQKSAELDDFLDHTTRLRELYINTLRNYRSSGLQAEGQFLSMRQTFPHLKWVHVSDPAPAFEDQLGFAARHQGVTSLLYPSFIPVTTTGAPTNPDLPSLIPYPNLKFTPLSGRRELQLLAMQGRFLSHVVVAFDQYSPKPWLQVNSVVTWLAGNSDAAKAVTCLEILQEHGDLNYSIPYFDEAFSSTCLPNLTELSLVFGDNEGDRQFTTAQFDQMLQYALVNLVSASKLRVLRMCDGSRQIKANELCNGTVFPPSLELFAWLEAPNRMPQYFRFVPTAIYHGFDSSYVRGGKLGKLQRVPAVSRARITKEGVWERSFHSMRTATVLEHVPGPPRLALD